MGLRRLLAKEQRAYLRRDRRGWEDHLARARGFFGEGLRRADPAKPVLILGAGTGLEIPWGLAPRGTTGWDADPWSRLGTALRHRRLPPWVSGDFTGAFGDLGNLIHRAITRPGSVRRRPPELAVRRLAGLIASLQPSAAPLRDWIAQHQPGTILVANVLGQLGCVAERMVETAFHPVSPWAQDPELPDPLAQALDAWTVRLLRAVGAVLGESGAWLWMLHDRAVVHGEVALALGPLEAAWAGQLRSARPLEVGDPLVGLDPRAWFSTRKELVFERWLWPVGPGQTHLMEALAYSGISAHPGSAGPQTV
jgi:hypothetical protein